LIDRSEETSAISKRDILTFFFKWKWTLVATFLVVVAVTTILVYLFPQTYIATTTVLVERNKAPSMRTEPYFGLEMTEVMNTEMAIVHSRTVMEAVVDRLHLDTPSLHRSALSQAIHRLKARLAGLGLINQGSEREGWIHGLVRRVRTKAKVNANIFTIRYGSDNPELAAKIVNAVTDAYLAHHLRIYSVGSTIEFYRKQVERAQAGLDRGRSALEAFKEQHALSATTARKNGLVEEMGQLREEEAGVEAKLAEVLSHYAPSHPKARLQQERLVSIYARLNELRNKLEDLERNQVRAEEMAMVVRSQEETYLSYLKKLEEAKSGNAENVSMANIRVIDYAVSPEKPRFPRILFILASVVAGTLRAVLIARGRESFDHRVLTPEAAEAALGVSVVGSIRRFHLWERLAGV
jgi:uncharacterized protein involved in exopolysaccharide biosynthesis